jgi:hypothetical protein
MFFLRRISNSNPEWVLTVGGQVTYEIPFRFTFRRSHKALRRSTTCHSNTGWERERKREGSQPVSAESAAALMTAALRQILPVDLRALALVLLIEVLHLLDMSSWLRRAQ